LKPCSENEGRRLRFGENGKILIGYVQGKYTVTLIEGDGIGPEISQSVKDIFAAAKVRALNPGLKQHNLTFTRSLSNGRLLM
jgi:hypothetical protein